MSFLLFLSIVSELGVVGSASLLRGDLYQVVSLGAGSHFDELQDLTGSNVDHAVEK